jgi:hypothetical protein
VRNSGPKVVRPHNGTAAIDTASGDLPQSALSDGTVLKFRVLRGDDASVVAVDVPPEMQT